MPNKNTKIHSSDQMHEIYSNRNKVMLLFKGFHEILKLKGSLKLKALRHYL